MKLAEFEIQTALYARLNENIDCPVYDDTPQDVQYPHVTIGEFITVPDTVKCNAFVIAGSVHGWDKGGSRKSIIEIMSDVIERITVSTDSTTNFLTLTNFSVHNQLLVSNNTIKDIDGETWHSIATIEFQVKQN